MSVTVRYRDFPLANIDTPEEIERRNQIIARYKASLPEIYRTTMNGRLYRMRAKATEWDGAVYEWWYQGEWRPMLNLAIAQKIKNGYMRRQHKEVIP